MPSQPTERPDRITNHSAWSNLPAIAAAVLAPLLALGAPVWAQSKSITNETAKLLASDGATRDRFGIDVAISGDTAVISSIDFVDIISDGTTSPNTDSGAAYVFVRDDGDAWTQQAILALPDGTDMVFGPVAISGDTAIISALYYDSLTADLHTSALVFTRDADGVWTPQANLVDPEGEGDGQFGFSIAISGDTVIVGARFHINNGSQSGAAFIFTRNDEGVWTQQAKLSSSGVGGEEFGNSVAIRGDTVIVGAPFRDNNGSRSGAAFIFTRDDDGVWAQQAKLVASDGAEGDRFGIRVALSGDTAVIGATIGDNNGIPSGSAYIFARDAASGWTQQTKLLPSDGEAYDYFGSAVAINGDTAFVGSHVHNAVGLFSGTVYVFVRDETDTWTQRAKLLASDESAGDNFGGAIAVTDETVLVGAVGNDNANGFNAGAAYIFDLDDDAHSDDDADFDDDGKVDSDDLSSLLSQWGAQGGSADLNRDGAVNSADLSLLLANWG